MPEFRKLRVTIPFNPLHEEGDRQPHYKVSPVYWEDERKNVVEVDNNLTLACWVYDVGTPYQKIRLEKETVESRPQRQHRESWLKAWIRRMID